jgi:hypothetical protein
MLYSALFAEVLPEVPGCPDITMERAIRDSAIEFFDTTLAYTVDQPSVAVTAGLSVVNLAIPASTRLVQLLRAQIGRRVLERITRDQLMASGVSWQTDTGTPVALTFESDTSIRLLPACDESMTDGLYLRFAVTPTRTSTTIPDALGERYFRELATGAKSRLMLMEGKDWANQQMGIAYRSMYERMMREARLTESQDRIAASKRVRIRRVV